MLPRLFYKTSVGLAVPVAQIMNKIAQTGHWHKQLKTEWGVPLEKQPQAKDESQTRLISCKTKLMLFLKNRLSSGLWNISSINQIQTSSEV